MTHKPRFPGNPGNWYAALDNIVMQTMLSIEQLEELSTEELGGILLHAYNVDIQYFKNIVEAGANLEAKDGNGWTFLHYAARWGHDEKVQVLIEAGAYLEARDNGGWTPLHYAAFYGFRYVVKILISSGASKEALDSNGRTPWDVANPYTNKYCPELNPNE